MKILKNKYNSKRKKSTYLQYQDGDILEIEEKIDDTDSVPKLDINTTNKNNLITEENLNSSTNINRHEKKDKQNNKLDILKKIFICIVLISLMVCLCQILYIYINESKDFISKNDNLFNIDSSIGKFDKNTTANEETNSPTTNIEFSKKYVTMLNYFSNIHNSIYSKLVEIKSDINSGKDISLIQNKIIRTSFTLDTLKNELEKNKDLFIETSCENIYIILSQRIDNEISLINFLKKQTTTQDMINTLNKSILSENEFVNKQTELLEEFFKRNSIPYSTENNTLSWEISNNT